jgi:hypothetical protein
MSPTMEKPRPTSDEEVDYSPLLGFVARTVRIDPHARDVASPVVTDLRRVIEIVRDRRAARINEAGKAAAVSE